MMSSSIVIQNHSSLGHFNFELSRPVNPQISRDIFDKNDLHQGTKMFNDKAKIFVKNVKKFLIAISILTVAL